MSDAGDTAFGDLPEARIKTRTNFSLVWIIPIVAALIGGWLAYKGYMEKGPVITVTFKTAEGIEAGKTKVKYKDVEIGQVEDIQISDDVSHVILTVELHREAKPYLREDTRFWVVRARVAAGQVSGIGTLFSGAYIGIDPGHAAKSAHRFTGLEVPPIVTMDEPGREFVLQAAGLGSHDVGTPVYFRKIKVGQVIAYELDEDGAAVSLRIFIREPYDAYVFKSTRFWDASGVDVSLGAEGIKVDTESLVSMLVGGIAFETPENLEARPRAPAEHVFTLYTNREQSRQKTYAMKQRYLLYFAGSVRGLAVGAPVELKGIKIGQVTDVRLQYDVDAGEFRIPVLVEIEPERLDIIGDIEEDDQHRRTEVLIQKGLRAQLQMGNVLTGKLLIGLDFFPDAEPATLAFDGHYPEFPTVPTPLEEISTSVTQILAKLETIPFDQIGTNLNESLGSLNATLEQTKKLAQSIDTGLAPAAANLLSQIESTLAQVQRTFADDSPLASEMRGLMDELAQAARSIRLMADYLERHPEALIQGKGGR
jgi:paraquat-inducible protein B